MKHFSALDAARRPLAQLHQGLWQRREGEGGREVCDKGQEAPDLFPNRPLFLCTKSTLDTWVMAAAVPI